MSPPLAFFMSESLKISVRVTFFHSIMQTTEGKEVSFRNPSMFRFTPCFFLSHLILVTAAVTYIKKYFLFHK